MKRTSRAALHTQQCSVPQVSLKKVRAEKIVQGLSEIYNDNKSGKLSHDMEAEDIHTFIEGELTERHGRQEKGFIQPDQEMIRLHWI